MLLSAHAVTLTNNTNYTATEPEPELIWHTAAPGIIAMPRVDATEMVVAYDITLVSREEKIMCRWRSLDENGEGEGFWTKWTDYSHEYTFTTPGRYVLETYAIADGKESSPILNVTFKVDYIGMTLAPGIMIMPYEQRGYYVTLTSAYGDDLYYRWRHYDANIWYKWRLYNEAIPFTEAGQYVLEVRCDGESMGGYDVLGAYIEVPSVDYCATGDVNHNGTVEISDITELINMILFHTEIGTGDVDKDGIVNINDLTTLISMLMKNN